MVSKVEIITLHCCFKVSIDAVINNSLDTPIFTVFTAAH